MNKKVSKFLEFNGKTLVFLSKDSQYWIALKPICEALNIDYVQQFKNAQNSPIYGELLCNHTMVAADGKSRKMASLPEEWIYGWIMQLQSNSSELNEYKKECHRILFKYFHGAITGRKELLTQKAKAQMEIDQVINSLNPDLALKLERNRKILNRVNSELRKMDSELIEEERDLFTQ